MENCEPQLSCIGCDTKVYTMRDLLKHKKNCPGRECVICKDKMACSILEPCLHNNFCAECIYRVLQSSDKCPLCRSVVQHVHATMSYTFNEILDKAAKMIIVNFQVVDQFHALGILQMKIITNAEPIQGAVLEIIQHFMNVAWPQIEERASQMLHAQNLDFEELVNAMSNMYL